MNPQQLVSFETGANKIFLFDEVYTFAAAREQAEKKKLAAFGMLARVNMFNRPKEETVLLAREERRLEPFWHVAATRSVDYTCQVTYPVPVHNPHAQSLFVDGKAYDVTRQGDKARIDLQVLEGCHRKIRYESLLDGLRRDIKPAVLQRYIDKRKYAEFESLDRPEIVKPLLPLAAAIQTAGAKLNGEAVNAFEIASDQVKFEKTHLYLRPVYAFEFVWSTADKRGVIEVDGLTGEVVEDGQWFKDKLERLMTRDTLFDIGADMAGSFVPGGSVAVKVIEKLTAPVKRIE